VLDQFHNGDSAGIDEVMARVEGLVIPLESVPFDIFDRHFKSNWDAVMIHFRVSLEIMNESQAVESSYSSTLFAMSAIAPTTTRLSHTFQYVKETLPIFLANLASDMDRSSSKMWELVRELFEEGASTDKNYWGSIVLIFIEMLPLVFDIFDRSREKIYLLRDVCIILVIAIQCGPEEVLCDINTGLKIKLGKIGSCVEVPDFQVQSLAIETLRRMDKYIPEAILKEALPSQLRRHWSRLREPNTFWKEVRLVLNDYNSYKDVHHPQSAMFSLKARNSVTTFTGSTAKFDLNLEWFDVGPSSITCTADLKDGQDAEPMEFFFQNVRDANFLPQANELSLELQFVCNELSYFLKKNCNCDTDEKTVHFLTVNLDINKNAATSFKTEFHDRCRLSPYFATHSTYSTASWEKVCVHIFHPKPQLTFKSNSCPLDDEGQP
jgi:hypothetical protein